MSKPEDDKKIPSVKKVRDRPYAAPGAPPRKPSWMGLKVGDHPRLPLKPPKKA